MSDISPNAVSLEDAQPSLESPPVQQPAVEEHAAAADDDALPEGVTASPDGKVDVSVLAAERKRVRAATERAIRAELEPKARKADELQAALNEIRPIVDDVRRYGLPKPPPPSRAEDSISDEEATAEARDLELYDQRTGQLDVSRAKRIIARRRSEVTSAAQQAAQAAVGPITSQTAQSQSRENFVRMATQQDSAGQRLVDPKVLAEMWASLPSELTQHAEVADLVLNAAIGKAQRSGSTVRRPERAPTFSESPGGKAGPSWQMDNMAKSIAKHAGMSEKAFSDAGKGYVPGGTNTLGD